jgi:hypothetical protein
LIAVVVIVLYNLPFVRAMLMWFVNLSRLALICKVRRPLGCYESVAEKMSWRLSRNLDGRTRLAHHALCEKLVESLYSAACEPPLSFNVILQLRLFFSSSKCM